MTYDNHQDATMPMPRPRSPWLRGPGHGHGKAETGVDFSILRASPSVRCVSPSHQVTSSIGSCWFILSSQSSHMCQSRENM